MPPAREGGNAYLKMFISASTVNSAIGTAISPGTWMGMQSTPVTILLSSSVMLCAILRVSSPSSPLRSTVVLVLDLVQQAVDEGERVDAGLRLAERLADRVVRLLVGLQAEQAHHDLQVVLDAMMGLADQHRLLRDGVPEARVAVLDAGGHLSMALPSRRNSSGAPSSAGLAP